MMNFSFLLAQSSRKEHVRNERLVYLPTEINCYTHICLCIELTSEATWNKTQTSNNSVTF